MLSRSTLALVIGLLMAPLAGGAQILTPDDPTPDLAAGLQPYQSYHGSDIDQVNLSNGNLHVRIPLVSYPQRGGKLRLDYALEFNGKSITVQCVPATPDPGCAEYAWGAASGPHGWGVADEQNVGTTFHAVNFQLTKASTTVYRMATFNTPDGAAHPGAPILSVSGQTGQVSLDGSGFFTGYQDDSATTCTSHCYTSDADGISYYPSTGITREDSNGNWIASNADGSVTDTMGRNIPGVPVPSTSGSSTGCTGSLPIYAVSIWQVPGFNGNPETFKFCYVAITLNVPPGVADAGLSLAPPITTMNARYIERLQSVLLPNGQAWTFEYKSKDPSDSGDSWNYGDLTSIALPTGGSISYGYHVVTSESTSAMWVASRTVKSSSSDPGSLWQYFLDSQTASSMTMRVRDPLNNDTVHVFTNYGNYFFMETSTNWYSGAYSASAQPLKSVGTTYSSGQYYYSNTDAKNFVVTAFPIKVVTTLDNVKTTETDTTYCCDITVSKGNSSNTASATYGLPQDVKVYDYGSGAAGGLLQEKKTAYQVPNTTSFVLGNLLNAVASVDIYNGAGTHVASTSYIYDEPAYLSSSGLGSSLQLASSILTGIRGNVTSTTHWLNGGVSPITHVNWYDDGEPYQQIDAKGYASATSTYSSGVFWGGLPTSIKNAAGQITQYSYDNSGGMGLVTGVTDPNLQTTGYGYLNVCTGETDPLNRLSSVTYPGGGKTNICYNDTGSIGEMVLQQINPSATKQSQSIVDGLGRASETIFLTDHPSATYTLKTYDGLGRTYQTWNPTRCGAIITNCGESTWGFTTNGYDALGRMISQTDSDNTSTQHWGYSGNTVTYTDENVNKWQRTSDALGRLTQILEPNASSQLPSMETDYGYNALGNLTSIKQCGVNCSSGAINRSFTYDSLSRLVCSSNPENSNSLNPVAACPATPPSSHLAGTTAYVYDANGNLVSKTDTRGMIISYNYDALNRTLSKSYSDGITPYSCYQYDASSSVNGVGRLTAEWTVPGSQSGGCNSAPLTKRTILAYDGMGRALSEQQCTPNPSGPGSCTNLTQDQFSMSYVYDLAGNLTAYSNGVSNVPEVGSIAFGSQYDETGRLQNLSSSWDPTSNSSTNPISLFTAPANGYAPIGAIQKLVLGKDIFVDKTYDSRLRVTGQVATHP